MSDSYCDSCGKTLSSREIGSGDARRIRGSLFCGACAARQPAGLPRGALLRILAILLLAGMAGTLFWKLRPPPEETAAEPPASPTGGNPSAGAAPPPPELQHLRERLAAQDQRIDGLVDRLHEILLARESMRDTLGEELAATRRELRETGEGIASIRNDLLGEIEVLAARLERIEEAAIEAPLPPREEPESRPPEPPAPLPPQLDARTLALRRRIGGEDPIDRARAIQETIDLGLDPLAADLVEALRDDYGIVRRTAAKGLGDLRIVEAVPDLVRAIRSEEARITLEEGDPLVLVRAWEALQSIVGESFDWVDATADERHARLNRWEGR